MYIYLSLNDNKAKYLFSSFSTKKKQEEDSWTIYIPWILQNSRFIITIHYYVNIFRVYFLKISLYFLSKKYLFKYLRVFKSIKNDISQVPSINHSDLQIQVIITYLLKN